MTAHAEWEPKASEAEKIRYSGIAERVTKGFEKVAALHEDIEERKDAEQQELQMRRRRKTIGMMRRAIEVARGHDSERIEKYHKLFPDEIGYRELVLAQALIGFAKKSCDRQHRNELYEHTASELGYFDQVQAHPSTMVTAAKLYERLGSAILKDVSSLKLSAAEMAKYATKARLYFIRAKEILEANAAHFQRTLADSR